MTHEFQYKPQTVEIGKRSNPADTVEQYVHEVPKSQKIDLLKHLLQDNEMYSVLVFTRTKYGADRVARQLGRSKISSGAIHSNRSQNQRARALQDFKDGKIRVLVATDIAARGIDVDGITHVVNFDFPPHTEDYAHRIGRPGGPTRTGWPSVSLRPTTGMLSKPSNASSSVPSGSGNRKASSASRIILPKAADKTVRPVVPSKAKGSPGTEETAPKDAVDAKAGAEVARKAAVEKTPPRRTKGMLKAAVENPSFPEAVALQGVAVSVAEPIVPQRSVRFAENSIRPQSADSNHFLGKRKFDSLFWTFPWSLVG